MAASKKGKKSKTLGKKDLKRTKGGIIAVMPAEGAFKFHKDEVSIKVNPAINPGALGGILK